MSASSVHPASTPQVAPVAHARAHETQARKAIEAQPTTQVKQAQLAQNHVDIKA